MQLLGSQKFGIAVYPEEKNNNNNNQKKNQKTHKKTKTALSMIRNTTNILHYFHNLIRQSICNVMYRY